MKRAGEGWWAKAELDHHARILNSVQIKAPISSEVKLSTFLSLPMLDPTKRVPGPRSSNLPSVPGVKRRPLGAALRLCLHNWAAAKALLL